MYEDKITNLTLDSLIDYFNLLEKTGYLKNKSVFELLGLLLAESFLNTDLNTFITEEDYNIISQFLYCLFNRNCLIPYPQFIENIPQISTVLPSVNGIQSLRITEDDILRITELNDLRETEYKTDYWNN